MSENTIYRDALKLFMEKQTEEMLIHKWIESEKAKRDLGELCLALWVKSYAKSFRKNYKCPYGIIK